MHEITGVLLHSPRAKIYMPRVAASGSEITRGGPAPLRSGLGPEGSNEGTRRVTEVAGRPRGPL